VKTASHSKVAIVTGGAVGIGASVASTLACNGHSVVIADIDDGKGLPFAGRLKQEGGHVHYVHADISRSGDVKNLIKQTVDIFGGLDWLVNNAGIVLSKSVMEVSEEEWDRVLAINLTGAFLCTKYAIPYLTGRQDAAIVNVASNAGLVGFSDLAAYCASKGGMIQLTKATALDCAPLGIRVNAVAPGQTRTPMGMKFINAQPDPAAFEAEFVNTSHPIGRMCEPEEVAETIYFLLTEKASYITGAILSVDGGYTTR
jgi:NAD(P)-dependent dehydrogenase (short-subunit alcohol dehydrogenase family)